MHTSPLCVTDAALLAMESCTHVQVNTCRHQLHVYLSVDLFRSHDLDTDLHIRTLPILPGDTLDVLVQI